jgi:predicted DNA-binding transcriptional regulator AlpA
MIDTNAQKRMLRVPEAATFLSVSVSYLNALRCRGGGPVFVRMGRAVAYHPDDLEAWLAARRRASTSDQGGAR